MSATETVTKSRRDFSCFTKPQASDSDKLEREAVSQMYH